ncbi:MAG: hypothetical protein GXC94_13130 [Comamonadaceae bacterium]|nr:hypothetical protein [Comamonadaceae bacterium]
MLLDLNDVESIVRWWSVLPERHDSYLDYKLRVSPEFAPAILEARRRITGSTELQALLARSVKERQQQEAIQSERRSRMSAVELLRRDLAAA